MTSTIVWVIQPGDIEITFDCFTDNIGDSKIVNDMLRYHKLLLLMRLYLMNLSMEQVLPVKMEDYQEIA